MILCLGFTITYCMTYFCMMKIMSLANASLNSLIVTLSPTVAMLFWITITSANNWAGGSKYNSIDLIFTLLSIPFLILGSFIYKTGDVKKEEVNHEQLEEVKKEEII